MHASPNGEPTGLSNSALHRPRRLAAVTGTGRDLAGLKASTTPSVARRRARWIATWLRAHHDRIVHLPGVAAYHDDLVDLVRTYAGRYDQDTHEKPLRKRLCVVCLTYKVTARTTWRGKIEVRCTECGQGYKTDFEEIFGADDERAMADLAASSSASQTQQTHDEVLGS